MMDDLKVPPARLSRWMTCALRDCGGPSTMTWSFEPRTGAFAAVCKRHEHVGRCPIGKHGGQCRFPAGHDGAHEVVVVFVVEGVA